MNLTPAATPAAPHSLKGIRYGPAGTAEFVAAINAACDRERAYQDAKHGCQPRPVSAHLLIAEAELHEAKTAWLKADGDLSAEVLREVLQAMAALRHCLEEWGYAERDSLVVHDPR